MGYSTTYDIDIRDGPAYRVEEEMLREVLAFQSEIDPETGKPRIAYHHPLSIFFNKSYFKTTLKELDNPEFNLETESRVNSRFPLMEDSEEWEKLSLKYWFLKISEKLGASEPEMQIILYGHGEDPDDSWVVSFKNGKMARRYLSSRFVDSDFE